MWLLGSTLLGVRRYDYFWYAVVVLLLAAATMTHYTDRVAPNTERPPAMTLGR
jgi:hypothetical protein